MKPHDSKPPSKSPTSRTVRPPGSWWCLGAVVVHLDGERTPLRVRLGHCEDDPVAPRVRFRKGYRRLLAAYDEHGVERSEELAADGLAIFRFECLLEEWVQP